MVLSLRWRLPFPPDKRAPRPPAAAPPPDIRLLLVESPRPPGTSDSPPDYLVGWEREEWRRLKHAQRREEWTLGRWTAKRLLAECLAEERRHTVRLDRLRIDRREDGSPIPVTEDGEPLAWTISLSHSAGSTLCGAVPGTDRLLGVDLELVEPRHPAIADQFFAAEERKGLDRLPQAERDRQFTRLWSGKEAVLKAFRVGLSGDTRSVVIEVDPEPRDEWREERLVRVFPVDGSPDPVPGSAVRPPVTVWSRDHGELVLAVAYSPGAGDFMPAPQ